MPNQTPTVFVIDPDPSASWSLEVVIRRAGWSAQSFGSVGQFLAFAALMAPCCLLLQLPLPELNGFDLLRMITASHPEVPVIAMSGLIDIPLTVRAMKSGAVDFLVKPLVDDVLLAAVGQALVKSQDVLQQEAELVEFRKRYESLSGRERDVMARVVAGLLNKQVGAALGISEITVKAHR